MGAVGGMVVEIMVEGRTKDERGLIVSINAPAVCVVVGGDYADFAIGVFGTREN